MQKRKIKFDFHHSTAALIPYMYYHVMSHAIYYLLEASNDGCHMTSVEASIGTGLQICK